MNDLWKDLSRHAARFAPGRDAAYERVLRRATRRRAARRITAGVTAIAITTAAFTGLWSASRLSRSPAGSPMPTPISTATTLPYDGLRIGLNTRVNGWVVLPDPFGIWVAGSGRLYSVDPVTGRVRHAGKGTGDYWDYDYVRLAEGGEGSVWVASVSTLELVEAWSGAVSARFDLRSLGMLDAVLQTASGTWVTASDSNGGQVLARIDRDNGRVLARFAIGQGVHQLVQEGGYLFVGSQDEPAVQRLDPSSGKMVNLPGFGRGQIAGAAGRLWIAVAGVVHCVDVHDLVPCGNVEIPRAAALASDHGLVWVLSDTGSTSAAIYEPDPSQPATITLLDGRTGNVLAGPTELPGTTPATISAYGGHAWVGFHDSGRIVRIDRCAPGSCGAGLVAAG